MILKLKEPEIDGKLAVVSDLLGSCPSVSEEDRNRYGDLEAPVDGDRLACMTPKLAETTAELVGASTSVGSGLDTVAQVLGVPIRVGVAQIKSRYKVGSVQEGLDKSEESKEVGSGEINNQVLDPLLKDISSDIDREGVGSGMGLWGCGKLGMETGCSSSQKGDLSSVELISGRELSLVHE